MFHLLSPDQQSTKIRESKGVNLNCLYTSENGIMLSSFFYKMVFATSELCPLGPAKVYVNLSDRGAGCVGSQNI